MAGSTPDTESLASRWRNLGFGEKLSVVIAALALVMSVVFGIAQLIKNDSAGASPGISASATATPEPTITSPVPSPTPTPTDNEPPTPSSEPPTSEPKPQTPDPSPVWFSLETYCRFDEALGYCPTPKSIPVDSHSSL